MEALLAFAAALVALRLAGRVAGRWRARRAPELLAWSGALFAYAVAAAALAWGAAHGWDARAFRVYYLFGGLLTAPLLGAGSLLIWRKRWAGPVALVYVGLDGALGRRRGCVSRSGGDGKRNEKREEVGPQNPHNLRADRRVANGVIRKRKL